MFSWGVLWTMRFIFFETVHFFKILCAIIGFQILFYSVEIYTFLIKLNTIQPPEPAIWTDIYMRAP